MESFQIRVFSWVLACFGLAVASDKRERGDRLLEEILELLQADGYPQESVETLASYVYGRPVGDTVLELGGVMVTLAAYSGAIGYDMSMAGETELARISHPEVMARVKAKHASKPTGSPLPGVALSCEADPDSLHDAAKRVYLKFGATTDYTEWRTLAEALGLDWRAEEARATLEPWQAAFVANDSKWAAHQRAELDKL